MKTVLLLAALLLVPTAVANTYVYFCAAPEHCRLVTRLPGEPESSCFVYVNAYPWAYPVEGYCYWGAFAPLA